MIEISEELREHFLTDSTKNNLVVDARIKGDGSVDYTNYYTGDVETYSEVINSASWNILANRFPEDYSFKDYVDTRYFSNRPFFSISFNIHITAYTQIPAHLSVALYWIGKDGILYWEPLADAITTSECVEEPKRYTFVGQNPIGENDEIDYFQEFNINVPEGEPTFIGTITISDIQVEIGNESTDFPRNYDISLDNEDVGFESLTYKESLCSKDNLKFGLCESSNVKFSVVNNNHLFNDARVKLYIENADDPINLNKLFNANWHLDKSGIMSPTTVYNDTKDHVGANYFTTQWLYGTDIKPFEEYAEKYGYIVLTGKIKIDSITSNDSGDLPAYLSAYGGISYTDESTHYRNSASRYISLSDLMNDYVYFFISIPYLYNNYKPITAVRIYFKLYDENKTALTSGDFLINSKLKELGVYVSDSPEYKVIPFDPSLCISYNGEVEEFKEAIKERVPLGTFRVSDVKSKISHLIEEKTVIAYDYLLRLEQNAADWYTQYMFGISSNGYSGEGFEFPRQIYSSFFDYTRKTALDYRDNYNTSLVGSWEKADILANHLSSKRLFYASGTQLDFRCAEFTVSNVTSRRYCVLNTFDDDLGIIEAYIRDYGDPLFRGVVSANIFIEETRSDHSANKYCVDSGDFFMVSPDCTSFKVYVTCYLENTQNSSIALQILKDVQILEITDPVTLVNGHIRLLFYDWNTKEIFPCDTGITGRDVVRSLLEPCGCLFRLNRKKNIPEFVYCTKGGLYPAENLYPADGLYPRAGTDTVISTAKYMTFERGENEVQSYGKIQIKKGGSTNETEPICQWQYTGNSNDINTYIIDDNIFYCAENMVYDEDMVEVSEMLENMWRRISNMGYTANVTEALGMPWIECGDRVGILTMVGGAETFVFRRTLKGVQFLRDTYESNGDEYTKAISNYNYGG